METKSSDRYAGSLKVSEEVVTKIAILAASEVEGVTLEEGGKRLTRQERGGLLGSVDKLLGFAPVKAKLYKEAAEVNISVVVLPGYKAATVGENVQRAVKTAVQNMTGIAVSKINVNIVGVRLAENV
ncbi:MAG: Asp23/Gls24 family envelope stress response protein [Oscillospiraceae bacterium]|jgi:uncharacterized alkaline shock family protein YloU|nr:Asp23/Gls24 family envelope stress response protein [Oscillospiraceae bacterium]